MPSQHYFFLGYETYLKGTRTLPLLQYGLCLWRRLCSEEGRLIQIVLTLISNEAIIVQFENGTLQSIMLKEASECQASRTSSNNGNARSRHDSTNVNAD